MLSRRPPQFAVRLVSLIWSVLSRAVRAGVRAGWLKSTQLPVRVVSVGNIQAGGAGKTPLVARIANEAHERGFKALILCRGYGGQWESGGGVLSPGQAHPLASVCGDEAALLHDLAPHAVIGVGADRVACFARVTAGTGLPDLVILDDGFQHWKIRKDLEIVAATSLTRGQVPYRDFTAALDSADLLVWTKGVSRPPGPPGKPWTRIRYRLAAPPEGDRAYWLVTGVADGADVAKLARESGYRIERHLSFPDHARYAETMVQELIAQAARAKVWIAVTGKDWVKWRDMQGTQALKGRGIVALEPELEWLEGRENWNRLLWES